MLSFWIFLHLVGMAGFLATHGVSMYVMFQVRGMEGDRDKIFDLCLLSKRTIGPMYLSTALLVVAGVAAGIQGGGSASRGCGSRSRCCSPRWR